MRIDINPIAEVTLSRKSHEYLREETNVVNEAETSDYVTGISRTELEALEITPSVPREIRNLINEVKKLPDRIYEIRAR